MDQRKTHLRIDFVVQEVADDETTSDNDLRYIKFGDDIAIPHVRDFFDRCGLAMQTRFQRRDVRSKHGLRVKEHHGKR
jgi:hypothetical protein